MSEELPNCQAALIFSKQYKQEVKIILETFKYLSKSLQFFRFLMLKIPEVRAAEDIQERQDNNEGDTPSGMNLIAKIKSIVAQENV